MSVFNACMYVNIPGQWTAALSAIAAHGFRQISTSGSGPVSVATLWYTALSRAPRPKGFLGSLGTHDHPYEERLAQDLLRHPVGAQLASRAADRDLDASSISSTKKSLDQSS